MFQTDWIFSSFYKHWMRKDISSATEVIHSLCSNNLSSPADFPWKKVYTVCGGQGVDDSFGDCTILRGQVISFSPKFFLFKRSLLLLNKNFFPIFFKNTYFYLKCKGVLSTSVSVHMCVVPIEARARLFGRSPWRRWFLPTANFIVHVYAYDWFRQI